jgi:hypothetical protein
MSRKGSSLSARSVGVFFPGMEIEIAGQKGIVVLPSQKVFDNRPGDDWIYVRVNGECEWINQAIIKR